MEKFHKEKQDSKLSTLKREDVWSVQDREEVRRISGEILYRAKSAVYLLTTEAGLFLFIKNFGKVLDNLTEKGVQIRIKVPVESSNANFVRELKNEFKIENTQVPAPLCLLIVDENNLILTNLKTNDSKDSSEGTLAVFSQSETLVSLISGLTGFQNG